MKTPTRRQPASIKAISGYEPVAASSASTKLTPLTTRPSLHQGMRMTRISDLQLSSTRTGLPAGSIGHHKRPSPEWHFQTLRAPSQIL